MATDETSVETWRFNFTMRFPAVRICGRAFEIFYIHPDHYPPQPGCIDFDPEENPQPGMPVGNLFPIVPIGGDLPEIEVTRTGDAISASFEFTHSVTGSLITANLSGSIVGDLVSFTITYHLPVDLQYYSMPLSVHDTALEMDGTVNYNIPADLTGFYQGTLRDGRIDGAFNGTVLEEFAVWRFHIDSYMVKIDPFTGAETREYLILNATGEWAFSNLRIRGYFTVATDRVPVLLVHGLNERASTWDAMKSWLEEDGYHVEVLEYDSSKYVDVAARELERKIQEMLNKSDKVDIIAHSYGGLVSRYYVENMSGDENVRNLIMLAPPNHGSQLADIVTNPEGSPLQPIVELFCKAVLKIDPRWDSLYHLRTTGNLLLETLNRDFNPGSLKTRYFVLAGIRHILAFPIPSWDEILPGYDDSVVTVDSASLEDKGVPLYCVNLNHLSIVESSARNTYDQIIGPILEGSAPDPSSIGCARPEGVDPDDLRVRGITEYDALAVISGDTVEGSFQVADDQMLLEAGILFPSCDFNFTLISPTGIEITPESSNQTADVSYFTLDNYWYYLIRNPEPGEWQYNIAVIEVPEEGVGMGFISLDVVPEFPSGIVLLLIALSVLMAVFLIRRKQSIPKPS